MGFDIKILPIKAKELKGNASKNRIPFKLINKINNTIVNDSYHRTTSVVHDIPNDKLELVKDMYTKNGFEVNRTYEGKEASSLTFTWED